MRQHRTHGNGAFSPEDLKGLGEGVVFEEGVRIWHPEMVTLGDNVYVGHETLLKGYHTGPMTIGSGSWIGQRCFFHSAGGLHIAGQVGVGPGVSILTSSHALDHHPDTEPILSAPLVFAAVAIGHGADIGAGAIILPGVEVGEGAQIGAGAVVTKSVPRRAVVAGNPARVLRHR